MSYNVVHRTIVGDYKGVITWTAYESKEDSDKHHEHPNIKAWYEKIAEGVTTDEAVALCSTDEAKINAILAKLKETSRLIGV